MAKGKSNENPQIARNRRAFYDYSISKQVQAGLKLEGWEVKSLRAGKAELVDSYVVFKGGKAWLIGCQIQPLITAGTHDPHDPQRTRELLLSKKELADLGEAVAQSGFTCLALDLHWKGHLVKCSLGLAKGKKNHDKREVEKTRSMDREARAASKSSRLS